MRDFNVGRLRDVTPEAIRDWAAEHGCGCTINHDGAVDVAVTLSYRWGNEVRRACVLIYKHSGEPTHYLAEALYKLTQPPKLSVEDWELEEWRSKARWNADTNYAGAAQSGMILDLIDCIDVLRGAKEDGG